MARTSAPLLSLDARGSVAGALVYSSWKGRPYVRQLVRPANPKSASQVGMRSMMAFLSQAWAGLGAVAQALWEEIAADLNVSPFNAYVRFNQRNWRDFLSPSSVPTTLRGQAVDETADGAATPQERTMVISGTVPNVAGTNWGYALFRSITTPFTTSWANCIHCGVAASGAAILYNDGPLLPDTYYYNIRNFDLLGSLGAENADFDGTIA